MCSQQFIYEKQRKVEINGDEEYWETIEKKEDWEIDLTRDDILTNPGYYIKTYCAYTDMNNLS